MTQEDAKLYAEIFQFLRQIGESLISLSHKNFIVKETQLLNNIKKNILTLQDHNEWNPHASIKSVANSSGVHIVDFCLQHNILPEHMRHITNAMSESELLNRAHEVGYPIPAISAMWDDEWVKEKDYFPSVKKAMSLFINYGFDINHVYLTQGIEETYALKLVSDRPLKEIFDWTQKQGANWAQSLLCHEKTNKYDPACLILRRYVSDEYNRSNFTSTYKLLKHLQKFGLVEAEKDFMEYNVFHIQSINEKSEKSKFKI